MVARHGFPCDAHRRPSAVSDIVLSRGKILLRKYRRPGSNGGDCPEEPARLHLTDGPYENYFYSDCNTAVQVVVTNPGEETDLATIEPRLLVSLPAEDAPHPLTD